MLKIAYSYYKTFAPTKIAHKILFSPNLEFKPDTSGLQADALTITLSDQWVNSTLQLLQDKTLHINPYSVIANQ